MVAIPHAHSRPLPVRRGRASRRWSHGSAWPQCGPSGFAGLEERTAIIRTLMKVRVICLLMGATFAVATAAYTQDTAPSDLPSAPSTAKEQAQPQTTPPAPQAATEQQPATPQTPPQQEGTPTPAAPAPAANDDSAATIVKRVNEVNVVFTVTDK